MSAGLNDARRDQEAWEALERVCAELDRLRRTRAYSPVWGLSPAAQHSLNLTLEKNFGLRLERSE